MIWEVRPIRNYAKNTVGGGWRVQRWCQVGHQGAYEMAFVHKDKELCEAVAQLLNEWDSKQCQSFQDSVTDTPRS